MAADNTYKPEQWVQLIEEQYGTAHGPSGGIGDGEMRTTRAGAVCEVFSVNDCTGSPG